MITGLSKLLAQLACLLGRHEAGDWTYDAPGACEQTSRCRHCGCAMDRRLEHTWGQWRFDAPGGCAQTRACERCGNHSRQMHAWSDWKWVEPSPRRFDACKVAVRACARCGQPESGATQDHPWGAPTWNCWDYDHDWFESTCSGCGATQGNPWGDFPDEEP
jgi:hypothetical protein